jgi:hypothetical protein
MLKNFFFTKERIIFYRSLVGFFVFSSSYLVAAAMVQSPIQEPVQILSPIDELKKVQVSPTNQNLGVTKDKNLKLTPQVIVDLTSESLPYSSTLPVAHQPALDSNQIKSVNSRLSPQTLIPFDRWSLELKLTNFCLQNRYVRALYPGLKVSYGLELSRRFSKHYESWASFDFTQKVGHSVDIRERTIFYILPLSAGFKYVIRPSYRLDSYLGIGISLAHLSVKNDSPVVPRCAQSWQLGTCLKWGLRYRLNKNYFISGFVDYEFIKFRFKDRGHGLPAHNPNLGGVRTGISIGAYI